MHDSRYNVAGATLFSAAIGEKYEREGVQATGYAGLLERFQSA
jgi:hypothetical protein